jgi:hypothetical protein
MTVKFIASTIGVTGRAEGWDGHVIIMMDERVLISIPINSRSELIGCKPIPPRNPDDCPDIEKKINKLFGVGYEYTIEYKCFERGSKYRVSARGGYIHIEHLDGFMGSSSLRMSEAFTLEVFTMIAKHLPPEVVPRLSQ